MLPKKETLEIEFKSDVKRYPDKDIIEAVSAMANTNGGILYLGVEDNGIVTGLHKSHMDAIGLVALIANNTIPSVSVRAEIVIENQHNVMKIAIPMSRAVVSTSSGKILKRRLKLDGSPEAVPMYAYEITSRLSELSLLDVSAQPIAGATLDDFDPLQLNRLKEIIRSNPGGEKTLLELTDEELEFALRLISKDGDKLIPTMTGLLLLGKSDSLVG